MISIEPCSLNTRFFRIKASFLYCTCTIKIEESKPSWANKKESVKIVNLKWPLLYDFFSFVEMFVVNSCKKHWLEIDGPCFFLTPKKQVWETSSFQLVTKELPIEAYGTLLQCNKFLGFLSHTYTFHFVSKWRSLCKPIPFKRWHFRVSKVTEQVFIIIASNLSSFESKL